MAELHFATQRHILLIVLLFSALRLALVQLCLFYVL